MQESGSTGAIDGALYVASRSLAQFKQNGLFFSIIAHNAVLLRTCVRVLVMLKKD